MFGRPELKNTDRRNVVEDQRFELPPYKGPDPPTQISSNQIWVQDPEFDPHRDFEIVSVTSLSHLSDYPVPRMIPAHDRNFICPQMEKRRFLPCHPNYQADHRIVGINQPCGFYQYVARFKDAYVDLTHPGISWEGAVFNATHAFRLNYATAKPNGASKPVKKFDKLISIVQVYQYANSHFMIEVLPHFLYLLEVLPKDIPVLFSNSSIVWQMCRHLSTLGLLDLSRMVLVDPKVHPFANELYFAQTYPGGCLSDSQKWSGTELAGRTKRLLAPDLPFKERDLVILVSRQGHSRAFSNWDALNAGLSCSSCLPDGYKLLIYDAKNYKTFGEIIDVFRRAVVVIGAHGAGLSNLLFTAGCTTVMELMYNDGSALQTPTAFYAHAIARGLDYWLMLVPGSYSGASKPPVVEVVGIVQQTIREKKEAVEKNQDMDTYCAAHRAPDW